MKKLVLLISVAFVALMMPSATSGAFAQQAPSTLAAPVDPASAQAEAPAGPAQAADQEELPGLRYYQNAFHAILDRYELLADTNQVAAFKAEWEHKFDKGNELAAEESTNRAIRELQKAGRLLGCPQQPDYKCLYVRALRSYMQYHHSPDSAVKMIDPVQRARWVAEWEHKFDNDAAVFKSEAATLRAIRQMRDSLRLRFDYVQSRERTTEESDIRKANFGGLGLRVGMNNANDIVLGNRITLLVHEPFLHSPAYGTVHYGDVVLKIEDRAVEQMTVGEVKRAMVGKPGSVLALTIRRGAVGAPDTRIMTVSLTRGYTPDPYNPSAIVGNTDAGVPIEFVGEESLKIAPGFELVADDTQKGTPAEGKFEAGDVIFAVNDEPMEGKTVKQAVDLLRGEVDTDVKITVIRKGERSNVTLKRALIQEHLVVLEALGDGVNLLHLRSFEALNVHLDVAGAIAQTVLPLASQALRTLGDVDSLKKADRFDDLKAKLDAGQGLDDDTLPIAIEARQVYEERGTGGGLILNLANNLGGDLEIVKRVVGLMLPFGETAEMALRVPGTDDIEVSEGFLTPDFEAVTVHQGDETKVVTMRRMPLLLPFNMPFTVIVNGLSASGSEWLAGVLQSNHRAHLHGIGSFGKGEGQLSVDLPYGFSLHVTDFEFFPGGHKSNVIGLVVDKEVPGDFIAMVNSAREEIATLGKEQLLRFLATQKQEQVRREAFQSMVRERYEQDILPVEKQDPARLK